MRSWDTTTADYERSFGALCAGTIERILDDAEGPRLLDVGCGTGELAARAVARGSQVVAVDSAPSMVRRAREVIDAAAAAGGPGAGEVREAELPDLPFADAAFDAVVANFVVNHVPRPLDAMREIARLLRPGGTATTTIWPAGGGGWQELVGGAFAAAEVVAPPSTRLPADLDFARTPRGLADLAERAGLRVVLSEELHWTWEVGIEDLWAGIACGIATQGQTYLAQAPQIRRRVEEEYRRRAAGLAGEDGPLRFASTAVRTLARAPHGGA
ncbi:class I SAM-dependent methyltransferase [Brachybacterium phenoliresistens]|uniref:class I SAM-dependent methyltransferase n=1 Tax=Brachybacterium phenoliresistens TaxID=396014 RepID=UPI0031D33AB1